jgi:predicted ATP-dependent endonuclease of OLD family
VNISKLRINGYRRFIDQAITFCQHVPNAEPYQQGQAATVVVGSNNSGKTSIVELMQNMLSSGETSNVSNLYSFDDFNTTKRQTWLDRSSKLILQYLENPTKFYAMLPTGDDSDNVDTSSKNVEHGTPLPEADDRPSRSSKSSAILGNSLLSSSEHPLVELIKGVINPNACHVPQLAKFLKSEGFDALSPFIEVKVSIDYTEDDDIRNIADYLLYFTDKPSGVYFKYVVHANGQRLSQEQYNDVLITGEKRINTSMSHINDKQEPTDQSDKTVRVINEILTSSFVAALGEETFYCNPDFTDCKQIAEVKEFKRLFNCHAIAARRDLDDVRGDRTHTLSSRLMESVTQEEAWISTMSDIQDKIQDTLDVVSYKELIDKEARESLNPVISDISQANGGHTDSISLNGRITNDSIKRFLGDNTVAQFGDGLAALNERSQGLGYSNLILILIDFLAFLKSCKSNARKINVIVIEEPESHMHPQMQSVFIRHVFFKLNELAKKQNGADGLYMPTCLITTHSTQIVQESTISQMRVLRPSPDGEQTTIIDLMTELQESDDNNQSSATGETKEERRRSYEILFGLNFADIVFADKVILFEGDTERMYLKALIQKTKSKGTYLSKLRKQYISYVQVGGRFAFQYIALLKILHIKSVILTDIDYPKEIDRCKTENNTVAQKNAQAKQSSPNHANTNTTGSINAASTINKEKSLAEPDMPDNWKQIVKKFEIDNPTLKKTLESPQNTEKPGGKKSKLTVENVYQIFNGLPDNKPKAYEIEDNGNLAITCQTDEDGYARTLEEAMLCKLFGIPDVFTCESKDKWKSHLDDLSTASSRHPFPMPRKDRNICVHDVVNSIANGNKTDFMYAIILSGKCEQSMPHYIEHSLRWLAED